LLTIAAVVPSLLGLLATPAASYPFPLRHPLPFEGFGGIAVDDAHRHVFVSSGAGHSQIAVLGFDGRVVDVLGDLSDPGEMVVRDGLLYVARIGGSAIDVVDTASLERRPPIDLPVAGSGLLASSGDRLWMLPADCWNDGFASVDPGTGAWTDYAVPDAAACSLFAPRPGHPTQFAFVRAGCFASMYLVEAVEGGVRILSRGSNKRHVCWVHQVAFSPSGNLVLAAGYANPDGSPDFTAFTVPDLRGRAPVFLGTGGAGVATSVDGMFATIDGGEGCTDQEVLAILREDPPGLVRTHPCAIPTGNDQQQVVPRSLALSRDGSRAFIVTVMHPGDHGELQVLPGPTSTGPSLTVRARPFDIERGQATTVTVHLRVPGGSSNRTVTLFRRADDGTLNRIGSRRVDGQGVTAFVLHPIRTNRYEAHWTGDAQMVGAASAPVQVLIAGSG